MKSRRLEEEEHVEEEHVEENVPHKPSRRPLVLEILVVAAVMAALSGLAGLNLASARRVKNELNARLFLRILHQAEENFRNEVQSDRDEDEKGEFGTLGEILGLTETASGRQFNLYDFPLPDKQKAVLEEFRQALALPEKAFAPPAKSKTPSESKSSTAKSSKKKKPKAAGPARALYESPIFDRKTQEMVFDGYVFRLFLPQLQQNRKDLTEEEKIVTLTDEVEQYWCVFAWPYRTGRTGLGSYFMDYRGEMFVREDPASSGTGRKDLRAIDAYEGREFETAVSKKIWKPWLEVEAETPKPPEAAKPAEGESKPGEQPPAEGSAESASPPEGKAAPAEAAPEGQASPQDAPGSNVKESNTESGSESDPKAKGDSSKGSRSR